MKALHVAIACLGLLSSNLIGCMAEVVVEPEEEKVYSSEETVVSPEEPEDPLACYVYEGTGCYWMENYSGLYCWVPADWTTTKAGCFDLDSCSGGNDYSGGGCYKWADGSELPAYPW